MKEKIPMYLRSISLLRKLLADQRFFCSSSDEAKIVAHALQTKAIKKAMVVIREKYCLDVANMIFGTLILASNQPISIRSNSGYKLPSKAGNLLE